MCRLSLFLSTSAAVLQGLHGASWVVRSQEQVLNAGDLQGKTTATMRKGSAVVLLLSLVSDSPQALVAGLAKGWQCQLPLSDTGLGQR